MTAMSAVTWPMAAVTRMASAGTVFGTPVWCIRTVTVPGTTDLLLRTLFSWDIHPNPFLIRGMQRGLPYSPHPNLSPHTPRVIYSSQLDRQPSGGKVWSHCPFSAVGFCFSASRSQQTCTVLQWKSGPYNLNSSLRGSIAMRERH